MPKEYRVIKFSENEYALKLLIDCGNFVAYGNDIISKSSFEELRSEVLKMVEAFGKAVIEKEEVC